MNWDAFGAISEAIGALAVVASLIYVGRQFLHSSTYALETLYFQTVANLSSTTEHSSITRRGHIDYESLTEEERWHFGMLHFNLFAVSEQMYLQYRRGLLQKTSAERALRVCHFYLSQPGIKVFWESQMKHYLQPEFVAALESGYLLGDKHKLPTDLGASYLTQKKSKA